jgi:GNAT superfamily N-acetyltransferase
MLAMGGRYCGEFWRFRPLKRVAEARNPFRIFEAITSPLMLGSLWRRRTHLRNFDMTIKQYVIRRASVRDAATIAYHRVSMFRDMGQVPTDALAAELLEKSTSSLDAFLREGSYVGWIAVNDSGRVLAGAGAHVKPQLPRISNDGVAVVTAAVPLVVNVYTEPELRGQGIARALMNTLMKWAASRGFDRVLLHASDFGRPLYQSLGFVPSNEMRWSPKQEDQSNINGG